MALNTYDDFAPVPWWAWSETMNKTEMRRQMRFMKKCGIRQFFIYASYGMTHPVFLSKDWWDYVGFTIEEARKLGMHVWIYDDLAWPSGTAAGHVLREHPEYRCRIIACNTKEIPAGDIFVYSGGDLPLETLREQDGKWLPIELNEYKCWINDTGKAAKLTCIDIRSYNGVELGSMRSAGTWNQRGYVDMLSPEAVKCWMQYIHIPYKEKFGEHFGKTLRGFFFDEPVLTPYTAYFSFFDLVYHGQGPCIAYTPGLFEMFQKRYGYDLCGRIHAIFYDAPDARRVRSDYWALATELMSLAFGKTLSEWCTQNHLMLTGHSMYEEPTIYKNRLFSCGEIYTLEKYEHIPGADLLGHQTPFREKPNSPVPEWGKNSIFNTKLPPAIARYSGARRCMVEAFGILGGNGTMAQQKDINNFLAAMGVNFVNDNTLMYAMPPNCAGRSFTQPWFKHYGKFYETSTRLSEFAAWGRLDTEIAVMSPETSYRSLTPMHRDIPCDPLIAQAVNNTLFALMTSHIDFELIFEEVVAAAPVKKGTLAAPNSAFRLLILPYAKVISSTVAEKLLQFCRGGGQLVFTGCRPESTESRPLTSAEKRCFDAQPFVADDKTLAATLRDYVNDFVDFKYIISGKDTDKIVAALRVKDGEHRLIVSNQGTAHVRFTLSAPCIKGCRAMDPDSGSHWTPAEMAAGKYQLELYPEQSLIFEKSADCGPKPIVFTSPKKRIDIGVKEQWKYELSIPNSVVCTMEMAPAYGKMADDPSLLQEWIPIDRSGLQEYLLFKPVEYPWYWLRGEFTIQGKVPRDLKLILPDSEHRDVLLNGKVVSNRVSRCFYSPLNKQVDLTEYAKTGQNTLFVKVKTNEWFRVSPTRVEMPTLPPLVLTGSFAATIPGRQTILKPLPKTLLTGDIAPQGFPQYSGEITYIQELRGASKCRVLNVEPLHCGSLEVELNGRKCGLRAWQPFLFDCSGKMNSSSNTIAIRLTTALGNLLPGCFNGKQMPLPFGLKEINAFEDTK